MSEVLVVFLTVAAIMALSFLGDFVSYRFLIPDVILLIVLGIICGPVLNLFKYESLVAVVPYVASLTLAFIVFDAGLKMDIYDVMEHGRIAFTLSILGFIFSTVAVGSLLHLALGLRWAYAFMIASAWGGISTATVDAVCRHLNIKKTIYTTLTISSLVDDPIVIISTLTLLNYVLLGGLSFREVSTALASNISISIILGILAGIAWLNILYLSRRGEYTYTFTLAAILLVYSTTEMLGGTGGIAVLVFGLILGNYRLIVKALRISVDARELSKLKNLIEKFHSELAFILRSFFFTFIGSIYVFTGSFELLLGLIVGLLLHATRFIVVKITTFKSPLASDYRIMGVIVGKGVAAATMSTLPLAYNLPNASIFSSIALNVILFTNVISLMLSFLIAKLTM